MKAREWAHLHMVETVVESECQNRVARAVLRRRVASDPGKRIDDERAARLDWGPACRHCEQHFDELNDWDNELRTSGDGSPTDYLRR
jgi:hypothetical protein